MPFAPTRQLYIDYSFEARGDRTAAARKEIIKEWNRLTPAERADFLDALDARDVAWEDAAPAREEAEVALAKTNALANAVKKDWPTLIQSYRDAAIACSNAERAWNAVVAAYAAFRATTMNLFVGYPPVVQRAAQEWAQEIAFRNRMHEQTEAMENNFAAPPALPRRRDGVLKIRDTWAPAWAYERQRRRRVRDALNEEPAVPDEGEGAWEGRMNFAAGGQGTTVLYVDYDVHGKVSDRMVQKIVYMSRTAWGSAAHFSDDVHNGGPGKRLPYEIDCHKTLSKMFSETSPTRKVNVPRLRDSAVDNRTNSYRIITAYCPYGSLHDLLSVNLAPLPEPFLWRTFHSLTEVGMAMHLGHTDPMRKTPSLAWEQIVHRDMKPANVFLDEAHETFFPNYPQPLLGDFGAAMRTTEEDVLNPNIFLDGASTRGYTAPEQRAYVDLISLEPVDDFKMLAHTNVYGVGVTMYNLLLGRKPRQRDFLGDGDVDGDVFDVRAEADVRTEGREPYSHQLVDLIEQCIGFDPALRPTFQQMLGMIEDAIDEEGQNLARGMKTGEEDDLEEYELAAWPQVRYRLGMTRKELPPIPPVV